MSDPIYVVDYPTKWQMIADHKATAAKGGHRWEAENLNGFSIFSNGRDLPMTYRLGDRFAVPIYELREQGVASVGTIGVEDSGVLMVGNIREIQSDKLEALLQFDGVTPGQGTQQTNSVTAAGVFTADMAGAVLVWADGRESTITFVTNSSMVVVSDMATVATAQPFMVKRRAAQAGALWSYLVSAQMPSASAVVTADANFFDAGMVGKLLWFQNGWHAKILSFQSLVQITLEVAVPFAVVPQSFFVVDPDTAFTVVASTPLFKSDWVGRKITWDVGAEKTITEYISPTQVKVNSFLGVDSQYVYVENVAAYDRYEKDQYCNTIGYKIAWSMLGEPRRWGAILKGTIEHGSDQLTLAYPVKSLVPGQQITVYGAGLSQATLTATIAYMDRLGSRIRLSTPAMTTAKNTQVVRTDAIGSIVGAYYLQDDASAILRIKPCKGELVVYKDTSIWLCHFTGVNTAPFDFKKLTIPRGFNLYYPYTLVEVQGQYHVYAGRRGIYRFDTVNLLPQIVDVAEHCRDLFFAQVHPGDRDQIWASDNQLTHEIMFQFPSLGEHKGLWFDYLNVTASTTSQAYTAGAMLKRPNSYDSEDWFVLGLANGAVVTYGRLDNSFGPWSGRRAIYYRRGENPYSVFVRDYYSFLRSGLGDFGDPHNEKTMQSYALLLGSTLVNEPDTINLQVHASWYGARNVSETPVLITAAVIPKPLAEPLVSIFLEAHCLQDEIRVNGLSPCDISMRLLQVDGIKTKSHQRRINP